MIVCMCELWIVLWYLDGLLLRMYGAAARERDFDGGKYAESDSQMNIMSLQLLLRTPIG